MKTAFKKIASQLPPNNQKNKILNFKFCSAVPVLIMLYSSCANENMSQENSPPVNTIACKLKPGQISFGSNTIALVYNTQDQPIKITTTNRNPSAPKDPAVVRVYTIEYNLQGNAVKVSKFVENQDELYYRLEYNFSGKVIKQSQFNAQNVLLAYTTAQYDDSNMLVGITTHIEGSSVEVKSIYQYADGNLIKKSIYNLYDPDSQEYYTADYSYSYFLEKENKITSYFEGPLGLLFISNLSNHQSLQYPTDSGSYQLFFAKETFSEKKMLKNLEIIAHRYSTRDTTKIGYSYEYDADGFPTLQKGSFKNVTRRYVSTPFGGSVFLITPVNNSFESTINFSCN